MGKTILAFLCVISLVGCNQAQQDAEETSAESTYIGEEQNCSSDEQFPEGYYTGPLIDSHFHMPPPEDGDPQLGRDVTLADIVCTFDAEGTTMAFAFFPVYPEASYTSFINMAKLAEDNFSSFFVPFLMPPGADDNPPTANATEVREMLDIYPELFQGYGEIGLYEIANREAEEYPPDVPLLLDIYDEIQSNNLLVYLHPGENHAENLEHVLQLYPNTIFIIHGEETENDIDALMERNANIYFTIDDTYVRELYTYFVGESKEAFMTAFEERFDAMLERELTRWKDLIEAHPDKFLWGTDRGDVAWNFDKDVGQLIARYARAFIGRLNTEVQERVAYKNAESLL